MQYFGGKSKVSKPICDFLNNQLKDEQPFVDLFCGSCNVISNINPNRKRYANDKHPYLITMFNDLMNGREFPDTITEMDYVNIKKHINDDIGLSGFVGFGCSFAGKWFGGYARSSKQNYASSTKNSLATKREKLKGVIFSIADYKDFTIPTNSLLYCDIPYKNTTPYCQSILGKFDHEDFYNWARMHSENHDIFISEYKENIPSDFVVVWEYISKKEIRNRDNLRKSTTEVLITCKKI